LYTFIKMTTTDLKADDNISIFNNSRCAWKVQSAFIYMNPLELTPSISFLFRDVLIDYEAAERS